MPLILKTTYHNYPDMQLIDEYETKSHGWLNIHAFMMSVREKAECNKRISVIPLENGYDEISESRLVITKVRMIEAE